MTFPFRNFAVVLTALVALLAVSAAAAQESRWVSDQIEANMRTGKSNSNAIVRVLRGGTSVTVLEEDREAGYSRIRTSSGSEGWILSRYLMGNPPARQQLPAVQEQLNQARAEQQRLQTELDALQAEKTGLSSQLSQVEQSSTNLESELIEIRRLSSNAIALNADNERLQGVVASLDAELATVKAENQELKRSSDWRWFVTGSCVLLFGIILGIILPRLKIRRRSRYGDL